MIFVDTNVFIYAVGAEHRHRTPARQFFADAHTQGTRLYTSAEVMQELIHVYAQQRRASALEEALSLVQQVIADVWPLEAADVLLAQRLYAQHPALSARDLCHLATCRRRNIDTIKTFDAGLIEAARALSIASPA